MSGKEEEDEAEEEKKKLEVELISERGLVVETEKLTLIVMHEKSGRLRRRERGENRERRRGGKQ